MSAMKPKLILYLALILSGGLLGCSTAAPSSAKTEQWHGFPILPPITNANPLIRLPFIIHVPARLKIERTTDMLSVEIDRSSFEATNLMVGLNMVTGVESKFYVYPEGELRPANGGYGLGGTDFNLGTSFWHTKQQGIPLPGKKYVVELDLIVFETDIPPQHMWSPQGSKNYKILWQRTMNQAAFGASTFLQNVFKKIEQQLPELRSAGMTNGTSSSREVWHGEEYVSGGFVLATNAARDPRELAWQRITSLAFSMTIHRYASADNSQKDLEQGLDLRPAMVPPKETYKDAALYRYDSGAGNMICQFDRYVIEISPMPRSGISQSLLTKALDVVLAELNSTSSKSK